MFLCCGMTYYWLASTYCFIHGSSHVTTLYRSFTTLYRSFTFLLDMIIWTDCSLLLHCSFRGSVPCFVQLEPRNASDISGFVKIREWSSVEWARLQYKTRVSIQGSRISWHCITSSKLWCWEIKCNKKNHGGWLCLYLSVS